MPLFALLLLLGADGTLPPGHPPIPGRADAGPVASPGATALPPGHPPIPGRADAEPVASPGATALPPGHPDISRGAPAPSARDILEKLDATPDLKTRAKPFEVAASVGKLYFTQGRRADAVVYFRQSLEGAAALRTLYLSERRQLKGQLPDGAAVGCPEEAMAAAGALGVRAKEKAEAGDHAGAAACALQALQPALEAAALLGNALFLDADAPGALAAYAWALEVDALQPLALYGRAGVHFDTRPDDIATLKSVKKDLTALLARWPTIPQAPQARALLGRTDELLRAGGLSKFQAARPRPPATAPGAAASQPSNEAPPPLSPEAVEAIRNTERTPELEKGLAELVEQGEEALAKGQYQAALDDYRRVVPFEPENGRAKAGMAWALVGLNRQPMADRVWGVAVEADPAAVERLGDVLAGKGNAQDARALWVKLAASAPAYAEKANLQKKLH